MVTPLGNEANMHVLDPTKVHLDRIALHYAVLQRYSILHGATDRWKRVEQVREEGTEPVVTSSVPCHHLAPHSFTVQGSSDLYVTPMWPTPSNIVPFLERQRGNACLIIYTAQVAWNFTVSYVILAHAFSRAWTQDRVSAHITVRPPSWPILAR